MAGNCFCRNWIWSWLLIRITIIVLFSLSNGERAPCLLDENRGYLSDSTETEIVIFLRQRCDLELNVNEIEEYLNQSKLDVPIRVLPTSLTCETRSWGIDALLRVLAEKRTKALVAALDYPMCEIAEKLARLWNVSLFTWTCPLKQDIKETNVSSIFRLSPSLPSIAKALAEIFLQLQWKTVVVIGSDSDPWSSLYGETLIALKTIGAVLRHQLILPESSYFDEIRKLLEPVHTVSRQATVLCLPIEFTARVLIELDEAGQNSMILMMHADDDDLFIPRNDSAPFSSSNRTVSNRLNVDPLSNLMIVESYELDKQPPGERIQRFVPPTNLSTVTVDNLLALIPIDQRYNIEKVYNGTEEFAIPTLMDRLNETLNILINDSNSNLNAFNNKMYTYTLLDWRVNVWKPIMIAIERQDELLLRKLSTNARAFRHVHGPPCDDTDCITTSATGISSSSSLRTIHIVAIILGSLLLTLIAIILGILIRKQLLKNRVSKGPYKIILTTSDFVFPQVAHVDSRRVDEGIETMLCCWLQQLQEFGGPEVDKPDLLQLGSVTSLKPYLQPNNGGNLPRHTLFKDPRAKYNGDLVQLKELPCQGTFELKNRAMDVLATIHGLRHENLNPLIGCLNEQSRPCLVYEYCSRGSLEDVLVQDEIKLDWSFRLSLLTDLVRGMRYLHGTPIRIHGYLTSRNCVIDARWVLKITDYGLPAFYEAQNIVPPAKTARELLWTAPELLRHPNLRKKGTQPADVYSFGIIMQEVVVRGEPFCMLALSPEDIIEKVMKPPPLIRPSVSKGAAPPEAINIMRQCWAEAADMRPDFDDVHDLFKKLNHGRKVNFVDTIFQMLEKYSNNLEELIRERTEQLDMEKKKTEQLLNRMLPSSVADKLKLGMPVDPEEFREVTIYFSDIVGFTTISAYSTPFQVVDLLNDLYTCFDATINAYTVYKVETIGDAYMVVGGCPVRIPDHASQIATMALDLLHQSGKFKLRHLPKTQLRLRIGLHTGPCCAGVVGLTMPRYCLFGDTVNTASRMESTGAPWRIHLSQATKDRLTQVGGYHIEYRGRTDVKGKGKMPTYWLLGKQGFDKELPTPPLFGENHGDSLFVENVMREEIIESTQTEGTQQTETDRDFEGIVQIDDNSDDDERARTHKIAVSVHDESSTLDETDLTGRNGKNAAIVIKSTSGDTQTSLGVSSNLGETTATTVLGASTSSLASISSSAALPYRPAPTRHRRITGCIDENDLSTPYNHYRCLSPNEHYGRGTGCRLLKRQFSLDRADEPSLSISFIDQHQKSTSKLYKQNSAGAANDLERIEEVPSTPGSLIPNYRNAASISLSVESLSRR